MVFSDPKVAAKVRDSFVPVALKAGLVNNPPPGIEGKLYREIGRSKAAPQGICVANSAGKVLAWTLSFDDEPSIMKFLDYALERFAEYPDATEPVITERYLRFPGHKMPDVRDTHARLPIPNSHSHSDETERACPGDFRYEKGTLLGKVYGRALDEQGAPLTGTRQQENYVEDRFEITPASQLLFMKAIRSSSGDDPVVLPRTFAEEIIGSAYLGQLDLNPLGGARTGGQIKKSEITLQAKPVTGSKGLFEITGKSSVAGANSDRARQRDGRRWTHEVDLKWEGVIRIDATGTRIAELVMMAEGEERLQWGFNRSWPEDSHPAAHLMAGRRLTVDTKVRYGLIATPVPAAKIGRTVAPQGRGNPMVQHLANLLGPSYRPLLNSASQKKAGLKLSAQKRAALDALIAEEATALGRFLQASSAEDRRARLPRYRSAVLSRLDTALPRILTPEQLQRIGLGKEQAR